MSKNPKNTSSRTNKKKSHIPFVGQKVRVKSTNGSWGNIVTVGKVYEVVNKPERFYGSFIDGEPSVGIIGDDGNPRNDMVFTIGTIEWELVQSPDERKKLVMELFGFSDESELQQFLKGEAS